MTTTPTTTSPVPVRYAVTYADSSTAIAFGTDRAALVAFLAERAYVPAGANANYAVPAGRGALAADRRAYAEAVVSQAEAAGYGYAFAWDVVAMVEAWRRPETEGEAADLAAWEARNAAEAAPEGATEADPAFRMVDGLPPRHRRPAVALAARALGANDAAVILSGEGQERTTLADSLTMTAADVIDATRNGVGGFRFPLWVADAMAANPALTLAAYRDGLADVPVGTPGALNPDHVATAGRARLVHADGAGYGYTLARPDGRTIEAPTAAELLAAWDYTPADPEADSEAGNRRAAALVTAARAAVAELGADATPDDRATAWSDGWDAAEADAADAANAAERAELAPTASGADADTLPTPAGGQVPPPLARQLAAADRAAETLARLATPAPLAPNTARVVHISGPRVMADRAAYGVTADYADAEGTVSRAVFGISCPADLTASAVVLTNDAVPAGIRVDAPERFGPTVNAAWITAFVR